MMHQNQNDETDLVRELTPHEQRIIRSVRRRFYPCLKLLKLHVDVGTTFRFNGHYFKKPSTISRRVESKYSLTFFIYVHSPNCDCYQYRDCLEPCQLEQENLDDYHKAIKERRRIQI